MWVRDESSKEVVQHAWDFQVQGSHHYRLAKKFHQVQKDILHWNRNSSGLTRTKISDLEEILKVIQSLDPSQENLTTEVTIQIEPNEWLEREEIKWRQKSRELWLKKGDRNSKFFHLSIVIWRRKNQIIEIQLDNENWIHSRSDNSDYFTQSFSTVYQSSHPQIHANLESLIDPRISDDENALLSKVPDAEEIKNVFGEMNANKAPGLVGFLGFFKKKKFGTLLGLKLFLRFKASFQEG